MRATSGLDSVPPGLRCLIATRDPTLNQPLPSCSDRPVAHYKPGFIANRSDPLLVPIGHVQQQQQQQGAAAAFQDEWLMT